MLARLGSLAVGLERFITGDWTSQREDVAQNDPCRAVPLLTRRWFPGPYVALNSSWSRRPPCADCG